MTPSDDYNVITSSSSSSSSDDYASYSDDPAGPSTAAAADDIAHYSVNNKIMAATIVLLFLAVFFVSCLQIYLKWLAWRRSGRQRPDGAAPPAAQIQAGLDKAAIALLPTFVYKQKQFQTLLRHGAGDEEEYGGAENSLLECAVCLSEFQENEKGRILPSCKHSFHIDCIDMWFYSHSTCPLCRTVVNKPAADPPSPPPPLPEEQGHGQVELVLHPEASEYEMAETPAAATNAVDTGRPMHSTMVLAHGHQTLPALSPKSPAINSSEQPSPSSCISQASTRYVPHITIEIPTRQDYDMPSPGGCMSRSSRRSGRCPSPSEQGSSTLRKSPGLHIAFKRMRSSRGKRVSCNQEGSADSPKDTSNMPNLPL